MKNILHDFYYGNFDDWKPRSTNTEEEKKIYSEIQNEIDYFSKALSDDDFIRVLALESMYTAVNSIRDKGTYIHAFRFGVLLMCAVFFGEEQEK